VCAALATLLAAGGALCAIGLGIRAVDRAEERLLAAETATAARLLREPDGEAILRRVLGTRWIRSPTIDPLLDEPVVERAGGADVGRAAVYDREAWDVTGQVSVTADAGLDAQPPVGLAAASLILVAALAATAWLVVTRQAREGRADRLARPLTTWLLAAALLVAPLVVVTGRWAVETLTRLSDRRVAIAVDVLAGRPDVETLARAPSGILGLTGLRFVPGPMMAGADALHLASGLPPETARALGRAAVPPRGRITVDAVPYAVASVPPVRLIFLPFEHTDRPGTAMAVAAASGVLAGLPVLLIAALARDSRRVRRELIAWSFLAPGLLHLMLFTFGPLLFAAWLSFHRWSLIDPARPFVGLANYIALAGNEGFWRAIGNTALFTLHVPVSMLVALLLALLVRRPGRLSTTARAVIFLPGITSLVAVAMVWQWILNDEYGLANWILGLAGLPQVHWLSSPAVALVSIMIVATWTSVGFQTVLFQAGLTAIPRELYDAARIDGAGRWHQFLHVTWPGLRPTSFFVFVTSVIGSFQVFGTVYVMTEGGPLHATDVAVFHIYEEAWELQRVGTAAAMSWVLFAIIFVVTWLHFRALERRAEGVIT
jgi:ABC-type sugar transport system permease subunit